MEYIQLQRKARMTSSVRFSTGLKALRRSSILKNVFFNDHSSNCKGSKEPLPGTADRNLLILLFQRPRNLRTIYKVLRFADKSILQVCSDVLLALLLILGDRRGKNSRQKHQESTITGLA